LTEEDILEGLPDLKIINVDLIRSGNGKSRGFGYLELESAVSLFIHSLRSFKHHNEFSI